MKRPNIEALIRRSQNIDTDGSFSYALQYCLWVERQYQSLLDSHHGLEDVIEQFQEQELSL